MILDYKLGNLFSVQQACHKIGIDSNISSDWKELSKADAIILPGVGAFNQAMYNLQKLDLISPLNEFILSEKPLFGICLGMQLLFSSSEEFGSTEGLNFISGTVKKFKQNEINSNHNILKIPNIGWSKITKPESVSWKNSPLNKIKSNDYMYFVHSYYCQPLNDENIHSKTDYGNIKFASSIKNNLNIFATQFHPEKSGENGLKIYFSWAKQNNLI